MHVIQDKMHAKKQNKNNNVVEEVTPHKIQIVNSYLKLLEHLKNSKGFHAYISVTLAQLRDE